MSAIARRLWPADLASRAALLAVALNAMLMVLKLGVGVITGSVGVLSDGVDSAQDLIVSAILLASVRIGARPPDETHPFGHGRAETLAATLQGVLIGAGGVFIVVQALRRLVNPAEEIGTEVALIAMLITAGSNLALAQYTGRVARITNSPAVASETRHLWTNVVQAAGVIVALVLVAITGRLVFDSLIALVLAAYLLWTAGRILWASAADVLDVSLDPEEVALIEQAILAEGEPVTGFHRLRTRRSGQSRQIDFHLAVPGSLSVDESHEIAERVEARILRIWPRSYVTIHIDPEGGPPADARL